MARVGLITFHRAINYGAVLQTYALQKTIQAHGGECRVIDFRSSSIEDVYKPFLVRRSSVYSMIGQFVKALVKYRGKKAKKDKVDPFVDKYLDLTEPITSNLKDLNADFDLFITGSDQVFNTDLTGKDTDVYLLSFAEKPRYSYAASFGKDFIAEKDADRIGAELNKYRAISVRERSGTEIVKTLIGKDADVHLDPTLLLDADEWRQIEKEPEWVREPYILVYNMLSSRRLYSAALDLSKGKGLKVVFVNNKSRTYKKQYTDFYYRDDLSPEEFLGLVDHAEYILCSSFHGTVFSILFHKRFVSVLPKENPKNTRIISLLDTVGLSEKCFCGSLTVQEIEKDVCWDEVDNRLKMQKTASIDYIDSVINGRL